MTIQILPPELQRTADEIRAHAKKLQAAIDSVDADIKALGPGSFEGNRADDLRARYSKIREQIYAFKPLLEHFATDLDDTAARFIQADRA